MSPANPKVSVVIPVFNTERYLAECLDSVLAQRLEDIEVLCIDDGSTDRSPEILQRYAQRDPRVSVTTHDTSTGPGAARNEAIDAAAGEYIACVDSDDHIHEDMLAEMYEAARQDDADVVMCMLERFSDSASDELYAACTYDQNIPAELDGTAFSWHDLDNVFELRFASCNKIYKKDFLSRHRIRYSEGIFFEDLNFTFRSLLRAERMRFVRKPFYFNRREREEATTFVQSGRVFDALTAMEQLDEFLASDPEYRVLDEAFVAFRFTKLARYIHKNDAEHIEPFYEALQQLAKSPELDDNRYMSETQQQRRQRVRDNHLLEYLTREVWDNRMRRESLQRQRAHLKAEKRALKAKNRELKARNDVLEQRLASGPTGTLKARVKAALRPVVRRVRPRLRRLRERLG